MRSKNTCWKITHKIVYVHIKWKNLIFKWYNMFCKTRISITFFVNLMQVHWLHRDSILDWQIYIKLDFLSRLHYYRTHYVFNWKQIGNVCKSWSTSYGFEKTPTVSIRNLLTDLCKFIFLWFNFKINWYNITDFLYVRMYVISMIIIPLHNLLFSIMSELIWNFYHVHGSLLFIFHHIPSYFAI